MEAADVEGQHRQRQAITARAADFVVQIILAGAAVGGAGHRVHGAHLRQLAGQRVVLVLQFAHADAEADKLRQAGEAGKLLAREMM
jgi:hypothetical protein